MTTYAIGDVQGCYVSLQRLLEKIQFDPINDTLWFVGDLVNRGPHSLETLRFIKGLGNRAVAVLGNHDLHLLAVFYAGCERGAHDTLDDVLQAPDADELCHWLRHRPLLHEDSFLKFVLVHAGIYPFWDLAQARGYAKEVETVLQGKNYIEFLKNMYGDQPNRWSDSLQGWERLRFITNCFTRMRLCNDKGALDLTHKGPPAQATHNFKPWFLIPETIETPIIFGHWAALECQANREGINAIDSGCVWGKALTALRLDDHQRIAVK